jgi:hypothetical protein
MSHKDAAKRHRADFGSGASGSVEPFRGVLFLKLPVRRFNMKTAYCTVGRGPKSSPLNPLEKPLDFPQVMTQNRAEFSLVGLF